MLDPGAAGGGAFTGDRRGLGGWQPCTPGSISSRARPPMWVLHAGIPDARCRPPRGGAGSIGGADHRGALVESVPLYRRPTDRSRCRVSQARGAMSSIGQAVPPREDLPLVAGSGQFVADLRRDGQLYARMVRSQVPRGRLRRINADGARTWPGVVGVHTAGDIPGVEGLRLPIRGQLSGDYNPAA